MDGCNWNCKLTQYLSNTCQIHCVHAIYGCKRSSKKYRIHWWMNSHSYFCEIKKHCTLKKTVFFRSNYFGPHPFLMNFYFTKIFVHLLVIAAARYFSVYKLKRWDPANIYLFKVNSQNTRKRHEIRPKFTINTIESCSGVFTVKCFYFWLWIGNILSRSSFSCKSLKMSRCFM